MLDRQVRASLRTLSKPNAEAVARHLVMAGRLQHDDPELAYQHAQAAVRRAGRVAFVREAAALTAYGTGRYAEALREIRTVRRLSGVDAHRAIEADCERGLGRPERAVVLAQEVTPQEIGGRQWVELCLVVAGARADMGQHEAGLVSLDGPIRSRVAEPDLRHRIDSVRADLLEALGRTEEAEALRAASPEPVADAGDEEIVVFDLLEEFGGEPLEENRGQDGPAPAGRATSAPELHDAPEGSTADAPAAGSDANRVSASSGDGGDGRSWGESGDDPVQTGTDEEERS